MALNIHGEKLYNLMLERGYPQSFAILIASEMNTEYTSGRMIGYISRSRDLSLEEIADEMLAILGDREKFKNKHISQHAQEKINLLYWEQRNRNDEVE